MTELKAWKKILKGLGEPPGNVGKLDAICAEQ